MVMAPLKLIKKRYRVLSLIGQGGFGKVYQVEDTLLGLTVALKAVAAQEKAILFLRREARYLASLKHAGIPSYLDFFEERGRWYLAMQYLEGRTLVVSQPFTVGQVIWLGEQMCGILTYVHSRGVIHRDIKPANILLATPQLYLLDFGISCPPGSNEPVAGSCGYAAPEQWKVGGPLTPKADIYALGMTMRHWLTGQEPADQASMTQQRLCQEHPTPPPPATQVPGYGELIWLLDRMTAEAPEDRPDVRAVGQELADLYRFLLNEEEKTNA